MLPTLSGSQCTFARAQYCLYKRQDLEPPRVKHRHRLSKLQRFRSQAGERSSPPTHSITLTSERPPAQASPGTPSGSINTYIYLCAGGVLDNTPPRANTVGRRRKKRSINIRAKASQTTLPPHLFPNTNHACDLGIVCCHPIQPPQNV